MKPSRLLPTLSLATACSSGLPPGVTATFDSDAVGLDVSERLGPGEVRAGVVRDGEALFGGVSAEGAVGDLKLYNDRVQFIIQGVRDSSYYEIYGGGLIDADVVRPEGEPGRDVLDELSPMVGLGRLIDPESVQVVADGSDGQAAVVRVTGQGGVMELLTGALESPGFVPQRDVRITTDYTLAPDAWRVEAHTTVEWLDEPTPLQLGDLAMVGVEVTDGVLPGRGLEGGDLDGTGEWLGLVGRNNEVALAIFSEGEPFAQGAIETLLQEIGPVMAALGPTLTLEQGDVVTFERSIGVAPDLATLTGDWLQDRGAATQTVGGVVTAAGAPVAGARVHVLDAAAGLLTIAHTDADGAWTATVPEGAVTAVATGRGHANIMDLPSGAGWVAPYAHEVPAGVSRDSLEVGATGAPFAEGFGASAPAPAAADTPLELTPPGWLSVTVADGGPAVVRVDFAAGDPAAVDGARAPGRPSGAMAWGYVRDGDLDVPVEPGSYRVTVHRGLSWEPTVVEVTVESGGTVEVEADLARALDPAGVLALDPHSHASPSGDGDIAMSHRLMTMAANGVQVHFGTDHDHVADYRPLLAPLELNGWLQSVVADEVSPVLRGHFNVYPLTPDAALPNNGAPRWWSGERTTDELYAEVIAFTGDDAVIQLNHPWGSSGMLGQADYSIAEGSVGAPDRWTERFTAMEVLNDGAFDEYFPLWLDLIARGYDVTPVGVSDAHGYRNGTGVSLTWLDAGVDAPADLSDDILREAMHDGRVMISRGPFLDARVEGAWAGGQTFTGPVTLEVDVLAASFVVVDTLTLLEDGEPVQTVPWEGAPVSFSLDPASDAFYVVVAEGSTPMAPVYPGDRPWGVTGAVKVDVAGDGWEAPKPPVQIGR